MKLRDAKGIHPGTLKTEQNLERSGNDVLLERSQIFEHMSDGVIVFDSSGTVIDVNPSYERMSRLTRRQVIGEHGLDIAKITVDPADYDRVADAFNAAVRGTPIPSLSIRFSLKDGSSVPVIYSTSFIKDASGATSSIICVLKDVSDIMRVEEALRESEERFRGLADAMTEMVWIVDEKGRLIYRNPRFIEYLSTDVMMNEDYIAFIHPEERGRAHERAAAALAAGVGFLEDVFRLRGHDGLYRWFLAKALLKYSADGRLRRIYGTATDIDDLKKAEEALKENLGVLAMAERIGKIGSWKQKVSGNEMTISDGVRGIMGIPPGEPLSFEDVLKCIHPDDFPVLEGKIRDILEKGTTFSAEYRLKFPDGSIKYILGNAEATRDERGVPVLINGSLQDITERKLAEEKIRALLAEKEVILREVHHRIKNNMSTMISLLALQANITKEPAAVEALKDAGNRMKSMGVLYDKLYRTENMRDLSIGTYLSPLVDEIVANFPNSHDVRVEKRIGDFTLPINKLSPLGIIVNELITNAMKHAFAGRKDGLISVTAAHRDGRVTISIGDNGSGMRDAPDMAAAPGFGLQLVGLLTKQLQGTMRIERENGTRFVLEFGT